MLTVFYDSDINRCDACNDLHSCKITKHSSILKVKTSGFKFLEQKRRSSRLPTAQNSLK